MSTPALVFACIAAFISLGGVIATWVRVVTKTEARIDLVDDRVVGLKIRLDNVEKKADGTDREVTGPHSIARVRLEGQIASLDDRVGSLDRKLDILLDRTPAKGGR